MELISIDKRFLCKGDTFCFPIDGVLNNSLVQVSDITLTLTLPAGVENYSTNLATGSYNKNTNVWSMTLNSGQMVSGDFCFKVIDDCIAPYKFIATLSSDDVCFSKDNEKSKCYVITAHTCCDIKNCDYESIKTISDNYDLQITDRNIKVDASENDIIITLLPPADAYNLDKEGGIVFNFKIKDLTNNVTLVTPSGKIVSFSTSEDASSQYEFSLVGQAITIQSDGVDYDIYSV